MLEMRGKSPFVFGAIVLIVAIIASLYHCESQGDRRMRCLELTHELEKCTESFR